MKRFKTAIVLALVVLALGGLATWDEWQTKQDQEVEKSKNKITSIKPEDVVELSYTTTGVSSKDDADGATEDKAVSTEPAAFSLVAKKDAGVWSLTSPVESAADQESMNNLINAVTDYAYAKEVAESRDKWSEFGLTEPARTLTLKTGGENPEAFTVYIGGKAPVGYSVYLGTSKDDKVYMGSQHLLTSASKSLFEFRDKSIAKINEAELKTLVYKRKSQDVIELVKDDSGYSIIKPQSLAADSAEVRSYIQELNAVRALSFIDQVDEALQAAFADPDLELQWINEAGVATSLYFVEKDGEFYASYDPSQRVIAVGKDVKSKLSKDLNYFRNRRILSTLVSDIQEVQIDGDIYTNINGEWYVAADAAKFDDEGKLKVSEDKPVAQSHIRTFVVDLEFAKTDEFLDPDSTLGRALATAVPLHRVKLTSKSGDPLTLDLFPAQGAEDKYFVKISKAPYIYRVAKSTFNSMTPSGTGSLSPAAPSEGGVPDMEGGAMDEGFGDDKLNLDGDEGPTG